MAGESEENSVHSFSPKNESSTNVEMDLEMLRRKVRKYIELVKPNFINYYSVVCSNVSTILPVFAFQIPLHVIYKCIILVSKTTWNISFLITN